MRLPPADPARRGLSLSVQEMALSFQHVPLVRVLARADTAWSPGDHGPCWRLFHVVLRGPAAALLFDEAYFVSSHLRVARWVAPGQGPNAALMDNHPH